MEEDWTGKSVSITCDEKLGVFQGIIKDINAKQITIVRAFRNGVPLRKQDAEVTLRSTDITNITLIPSYNGQSTLTPTVINKPTPVKQPNFADAGSVVASTTPATTPNGYKLNSYRNGIRTPKDYNNASTLNNKISNLNISQNGNKGTPSSSRASSVQQQTSNNSLNSKTTKSPTRNCNSSVAQFFGNLIPPKVEVRMSVAVGSPSAFVNTSTAGSSGSNSATESYSSINSSKPIDIVQNRASGHQNNTNAAHSNSFSNSNYNVKLRNSINGYNGAIIGNNGANFMNGFPKTKKHQRLQLRRDNSIKHNQTFGTSVDDPELNEDFDFEGNLALFDKKAIWNVIEAEQQPHYLRQPESSKEKNYRHDENVLASEPTTLRQIQTGFDESTDFVTDEGLIIPTIPTIARSQIEKSAELGGLSLLRQIDILTRGATDLALLLLGGARRLTPNNIHQWPKIVIICDKTEDNRTSNIGAATGRQLASHGLTVILSIEKDEIFEHKSTEISLFKASGNTVVYTIDALPVPDLVILAIQSNDLSNKMKKWLNMTRAPILAIDPPPSGIYDVAIKYAILPILPLNGISSNNCGKLYLCNLGIPDKFYRDAGIKYKSPFGHKFVIPIHSKD